MSSPISVLRDDFLNGIIDPVWASSSVSGSATKAETGGQAVLTLPSSIAGSHLAAYTTAGTYDLTGDQFVWNIATMVATGVAATAYFQLLTDAAGTKQLYWRQVSNAITARTIVGGVDTQLFTATWSAATYKYLRIREASGTIFFDSSTNGTSWTNRASVANPFVVTSMLVQFAAGCGNVASPGSLKLDDVNLILPALSTNWRWTQIEWSLFNRFRTITLASDVVNTVQGYIAVASSIDSSGNLVSPQYYSGPIGSTSGGYLSLTVASSQANAQAMAVNLPLDDRWDLPSIVECRFIRLYHRSIDGASYIAREYYARRLVQSDDIEAESIKAINIAAGTITADKITVLNLAALSAQMGALHMDGVIDIDTAGGIYQGSGTFASPTTGLKLFNSGGVGKLSTYNAGVEQVTLDTDGALKAGAGNTYLDGSGANIIANTSFATRDAYKFVNSAGGSVLANWAVYSPVGGPFSLLQLNSIAGKPSSMEFRSTGAVGFNSFVELTAQSSSSNSTNFIVSSDSTGSGSYIGNLLGQSAAQTEMRVGGALNVGSGITGVGDGQLRTSGSVAFGAAVDGNIAVMAKGSTTNSSRYSFYGYNSANTIEFYIRNDGVGFLNNTAWTYSSDVNKKKNIRALGKDIKDFLLLEPKSFDYIDGAANRWGYIAQDVQAIIPDLVETQPDGTLGMRTDELLPLFNHVLRRLIRILVQKNVINPADIG